MLSVNYTKGEKVEKCIIIIFDYEVVLVVELLNYLIDDSNLGIKFDFSLKFLTPFLNLKTL